MDVNVCMRLGRRRSVHSYRKYSFCEFQISTDVFAIERREGLTSFIIFPFQ